MSANKVIELLTSLVENALLQVPIILSSIWLPVKSSVDFLQEDKTAKRAKKMISLKLFISVDFINMTIKISFGCVVKIIKRPH